jgi:hypothetical protein
LGPEDLTAGPLFTGELLAVFEHAPSVSEPLNVIRKIKNFGIVITRSSQPAGLDVPEFIRNSARYEQQVKVSYEPQT